MSTFKRILYGGDYNPNQWPRDIWNEDMKLFSQASINSATINVFSWAKLQPAENIYDFAELDDMVEMLSKNDYDIVMATSTAALPGWLVKKYSEVTRTDYYGRHHKFGQRHNACPNSLVYQKYAARLADKLAERYGENEHISCWHVNNEYGGVCYCENCAKAFRVWLRDRYQSIEAVNKAWNTEFWGHTLYDWDEIVVPDILGDGIGEGQTAFAGLSVDYARFNSDSILENFKMERDIIYHHNPDAIVTTNLMGTYKELDYFKWAPEMDIVSWDNYPSYNTPWSETAMCHDLMRGLKNQPFMLMEQTPSQQNWQPYNSLKKPGQMRAQSYQTIAHGGDTIQFFQLRRSIGGCEKFHGAVIEHAGTDQTRVFREVQELGKELETLSDVILDSANQSEVGILFDWDNFWSIEYTSGPNKDLKYIDQIHKYYQYFYHKNISVDLLPTNGDFSSYKVIVAPVLYMVKPGVKEMLENYVRQGGILITTFMSGIVNESDNVYLGGYPGPLRELTGIWVEEIDALAPEQFNEVVFPNGLKEKCGLLCDVIHLEKAESLADYAADFYKGMPAITKNKYGNGMVYYIGTDFSSESLANVLNQAVNLNQEINQNFADTKLEICSRVKGNSIIYFLINFDGQEQPIPDFFVDKVDLIKKEKITKEQKMKQYDVKIVAI
ncbi:MAG: beta-galactosidase [Lachnospiraceae bacterium]